MLEKRIDQMDEIIKGMGGFRSHKSVIKIIVDPPRAEQEPIDSPRLEAINHMKNHINYDDRTSILLNELYEMRHLKDFLHHVATFDDMAFSSHSSLRAHASTTKVGLFDSSNLDPHNKNHEFFLILVDTLYIVMVAMNQIKKYETPETLSEVQLMQTNRIIRQLNSFMDVDQRNDDDEM